MKDKRPPLEVYEKRAFGYELGPDSETFDRESYLNGSVDVFNEDLKPILQALYDLTDHITLILEDKNALVSQNYRDDLTEMIEAANKAMKLE